MHNTLTSEKASKMLGNTSLRGVFYMLVGQVINPPESGGNSTLRCVMDTRISIGGSDFYRSGIVTPNQFASELYSWVVTDKSFSSSFSTDSATYIYHYQISRAGSYQIVVSRDLGSGANLEFSGSVATFVNNYKSFGSGESYLMVYCGRLMSVYQGISAIRDDLSRHFKNELSLEQIKIRLDLFLSCYLALRDERMFHDHQVDDEALGGKAAALLIELLGVISLKKPSLSLLSSIASQILVSES
jgi:hypothetical protein